MFSKDRRGLDGFSADDRWRYIEKRIEFGSRWEEEVG
jgi:hypothetical protein